MKTKLVFFVILISIMLSACTDAEMIAIANNSARVFISPQSEKVWGWYTDIYGNIYSATAKYAGSGGWKIEWSNARMSNINATMDSIRNLGWKSIRFSNLDWTIQNYILDVATMMITKLSDKAFVPLFIPVPVNPIQQKCYLDTGEQVPCPSK